MAKQEKINLEDILTDKRVEEDLLEVPLGEQVLKVFLVLTGILTALVIAKLFHIGILDHTFYKVRATANASYEKSEPAPRGLIVDRFGKPLLRNEPVLNVFLIPHELPRETSERRAIVLKVSALLSLDVEEVYRKISEKDWGMSEKLLLAQNPSYAAIAAVESLESRGVSVEPSFRRAHVSQAHSHLIGFTGFVDKEDLRTNPSFYIDEEIGKAGLELYYDAYLRGDRGEEVVLRDAVGDVKDENSLFPPKPGSTLVTFIDRDLQEFFYERLKRALDKLGSKAGVGIILRPSSGEVLALVSIPSFDARDVAASLDGRHQPLFNRAVQGRYNPGSIIKPFMAVAALSEGVIAPETKIYSGGYIEIPNPYYPGNPSRFLDWKPHGWVDVRSALARSSNVYFYEVGGGFRGQEGLGVERLIAWWQRFNLDGPTGIDIPHEGEGFLPNPLWKEEEIGEPWRIGDTYNVSIGQGDLLVTPIGILSSGSAIANGGVFYKPRVMDKIIDGEGNVVVENSVSVKSSLRSLVGDRHFEEVRLGMRDAVLQPYGTAHLLSDLPIEVAAKTGTAQVSGNEKLNAFFVGYAPQSAPEIAILVLVEDAREGSLNAVPVAYDVFLWYYNHRIKP